jgi:hypothetical protein
MCTADSGKTYFSPSHKVCEKCHIPTVVTFLLSKHNSLTETEFLNIKIVAQMLSRIKNNNYYLEAASKMRNEVPSMQMSPSIGSKHTANAEQ